MELGLNYNIQYSNKQGQADNFKNLLSYFLALQCNKYVDISSRFNFQNNIELQQFIDQNITTIRDSQFFGCRGLQMVNFPSCISIDYYAFQDCTLLQKISFPACTSIASSAFYNCTSLQSVSFPACTFFGSYAFQNCTSLQSVSFSVCTSINQYAFQNCTSLQSVSFPACNIIYRYAFQNCTSLQSVNFPVCIMITAGAFSDCRLLQTVNLPICIEIGSSAFYSCKSLSAIYLLASSVCTLSHSNALWYTPIDNSSYLGYFGSIYVPSSLVDAYKTATNWTRYSARITSYIE